MLVHSFVLQNLTFRGDQIFSAWKNDFSYKVCRIYYFSIIIKKMSVVTEATTGEFFI